ncbi:hypothetical protein [Leucobacter denitrificans]|nr:hypothetical protein [Leucobacter denitrificans]
MTERYDDDLDQEFSTWLRSTTFSNGAEFLSVSVEDAGLDANLGA